MNTINYDICTCILEYLRSQDTKALLMTSFFKEEAFWRLYAFTRWSREFWIIASQRPPEISKPRGSWKLEVLRLLVFETVSKEKWSLEDYYYYWRCQSK